MKQGQSLGWLSYATNCELKSKTGSGIEACDSVTCNSEATWLNWWDIQSGSTNKHLYICPFRGSLRPSLNATIAETCKCVSIVSCRAMFQQFRHVCLAWTVTITLWGGCEWVPWSHVQMQLIIGALFQSQKTSLRWKRPLVLQKINISILRNIYNLEVLLISPNNRIYEICLYRAIE